jgi:hypothetical protein
MSALLVGYARCSTDQQDLTAQRDGLFALGVEVDRIYVDHGLTGTNRERPGLQEGARCLSSRRHAGSDEASEASPSRWSAQAGPPAHRHPGVPQADPSTT